MSLRSRIEPALTAGLVAAVTSGIPSTAYAAARRTSILEGARAAGTILLPHETRTAPLLAAAVPVHLGLSVGWACVLDAVLPPHHEPLLGALGGLAIAAIDLELIGRRLPAIRALDQPPQWLDHAAYGLTVGFVLGGRRRRALSSRHAGPRSRRSRAGRDPRGRRPGRPPRPGGRLR